MGDVDDLQASEEAAARRAEEAEQQRRDARTRDLRAEPVRPTAAGVRTLQELPLDRLYSGDNIRTDLPDVDELARSIREVGLLSPLLVRPWDDAPDADGPLPEDAGSDEPVFRLIAGHRRLAALTALHEAGVDGFSTVPCEVRDGLSEAEAFALMLTENVQRVPLEPIQAARALRLLLDLDHGMDAAALARSLGVRPAWAQTHLKLLDLPREVQDRIEAGDLSVTVADLLRRGQSTGRIDDAKLKDLAAKVASGEITTAQVRAEAGPPPRPNTEPPKTVALGPDGRPLHRADADPAPRYDASSSSLGEAFLRPPTPLSAMALGADGNPVAAGPAQLRDAAAGQQQPSSGVRPSADELSVEERLDSYLLGRALREWADDEYLESIGIDRVQTDAWAATLGFEERIHAIRQLSHCLMHAAPQPSLA